MASFNGITFTADGGDFEESREARVAVQDIPGGDTFYADRAGRAPLKWRLGILLPDGTAWGALNSSIGQQSSLSVETLDSHTAILMRVSRPSPFLDGQVRANVEFLITD